MGKLDWEKFGLHHHDSDLFHRSEWDGQGVTSTWYVVYRVCVALFMVTGAVCHFVSTLETQGMKWFIYMTNQGISFLTIHYIIYAGIVLGKKFARGPTPLGSIPALYKFSWGMQTCFTTVALWITIIYWTALHKYVVEFNLMKTPWMKTLNVFLHGVNTISCIIDMMVTARPVRIHHFYFACFFGVWYCLFSLTYWAAGGLGMCMPRCLHLRLDSAMDQLDPSCPINCDKYIYPILDWEDHPGLAAGIVLGGCVLMPVLQSAWWGLVWVRQTLKGSRTEKFYKVDEKQKELQDSIL